MIDERDMPSEQPPGNILAALADAIMADVRHYYAPAVIDIQHAQALRAGIISRLVYVRNEAARARGDD